MIDRRDFFLFSTAAAVTAPVAAKAKVLPRPTRKGEVAALRLFAEQTHPRGREAAADAGWRKRWAELEARAGSLSDGAYFVGLRRGLGWFADGHTTVLPFEFTGGVPAPLRSGPFGHGLPIQIRVFHDGAYVTAAEPAAGQLLGHRVEAIGSKSVVELMRAHAAEWPGNAAWAHRWAGQALSSPGQLQGLGAIATMATPLPLRTDRQSTMLAIGAGTAGSAPGIQRVETARERWAKEAGRGNYVRPLPDRRALYISIDDMDDVEGKTFAQLTRDAFAAMDQAGLERVIVDLRRNGGGNNFWGEPLRKALEASRFNRPGGLYVLVSPVTFSAAQNLANRLERETFALFVGEPTGGSPNHYGDAKPFAGKATGISAIVSTIPWFDSYPQDERTWIMPDLPVPNLFEDWRAGRDRALDLALEHRTAEASDFLSRDRVFYYNRKSQKADWKPFWL